LFWPRGAASVVGDDLADAFRIGAAYLTESVGWALGTRPEPPDAGPAAVTAAIRLDEALRGFLAEQGAKHLSKADLWMLVMATMRLRLTSYSLAGLQAPMHARQHRQRATAYAKDVLTEATAELAAFYERVAVLVGRPMPHEVVLPVSVPAFTGLNETAAPTGTSAEDVRVVAEVGAALGAAEPNGVEGVDGAAGSVAGPVGADGAAGGVAGAVGVDGVNGTDRDGGGDGTELVRIITGRHHPHLLWVYEHLQHLSSHAQAITEPATHVAEQRRQPWWR
jgi:hypothetical protein